MEELVKFLENVGVSNETIALLKDPEEGQKVEDLADEFKSKQREVYANDPEIIKDLESKAKGKARGSVERKIKKVFNIPAEEWAAAELDGDYEKALTFGFDKQKKAGSKSTQEINTELQEANTKIKWYKEEEIPRIQTESDTRADKKEANSYLREMIANSGKLIVSEGVAVTVVNEELRKKGYKTGLNEAKTSLTIKTEDGLSPQDEGKTRNLSNEEVIKGVLKSENLIIQSNADQDTEVKKKKTLLIQNDEEKGYVHPDALQNVEDLKDMKVKGQK